MLVVIRMRHGNLRSGRIDEDFLLSGDYQQIRRTAQMISGLMGEGAVIRRGEKSLAVTSFADAMTWMLGEVERGLAKQRYKGLGEMNPEQLVGNDHGSGRAPPVAGPDRRRHRRRRDLHHADGGRRRAAPGIHRIERALREEYRRLSELQAGET
jgi:hypothetical protein